MDFKEYIEDKYLDKFADLVSNEIEKDSYWFNVPLKEVQQIDDVDIYDYELTGINIESTEDSKIIFTVVVNFRFDLLEQFKGDILREHRGRWVVFNCFLDIDDKKISNLVIKDYYPYESKEFANNPSSDRLVPFIYADDLDLVANEILKNYYPEALASTVSINPDLFIKRVGLKKIYRKLNDSQISGQIFLKDYHREKTDNKKEVRIDKGTIVINKNYDLYNVFGTENLTLVHEAVHWIKHKKSMWFDNIVNSTRVSHLSCKIDGTAEGGKLSFVDWMEWQANSLAPRILMPKEQFSMHAAKLFDSYKLSFESNDTLLYVDFVIDDLSKFYGVPKNSVKIRLIDCGFQIAIGAGLYLDNKHILPHSFKKDFLKPRETFSIENLDASILSLLEIAKGNDEIINYRLVENHLVYNSKKYILKDIFGNLKLTDYARHHMDECALVFEYGSDEISKYQNNYVYIQDCILCNKRKDNSIVVKYRNNSFLDAAKDIIKPEASEFLDEINLKNSLPSNLKDCFSIIRKNRGITQEKAAEILQCEATTIQRIENNEHSTLQSFLGLCIAYECSYIVIQHLLSLSPYNLVMTDNEHQYYLIAITQLQGYSLAYINDFLISKGITPLGVKNK